MIARESEAKPTPMMKRQPDKKWVDISDTGVATDVHFIWEQNMDALDVF